MPLSRITPEQPARSSIPAEAATIVPSLIDREAEVAKASVALDQSGQASVEGRAPKRAVIQTRAIGIMFGIDPRNLYETPDDADSRDQAVRDLD